MQLALLARETDRFPRRARRLDLRRAECLELEQRGPRVARSADVRRVAERMLAARAAQRVVRRASRRPNVVSAAEAAAQERACEAGGTVLLDGQAVDARGIRANLVLDGCSFVRRGARAQVVEKRNGFVREHVDAQ